MSDLHGLHLTIAEWILRRGKAVTAYDVSEHFGLPLNQATAVMRLLERDDAIKTIRDKNIPTHLSGRHGIRTLKVTAIDYEKTDIPQKNNLYAPAVSISLLSTSEKWLYLIGNARRRKK
ncbi:hypothetical protein AABH71_005196 [Salmonella enterica]|uniref:Uncharacterized protein n=1 Tax=Salmonella enterica I TaxID=59201 RepID=A0A3R1BXW3_SALET|nr:hypothetical protein [Salmonella enterica subsp. enterica serovar Dahomey]EAW9081138.1 hypothetical protein [Salmonella enterica]EBQ9005000.1 hypothetical protein [Salmonella enterica subsp. enterica serovar Blockley]ECD5543829.1 hypothetical protein [Salmonella enterica subsp. enterica serovar Kokomlemle]MML56758.1 hypothetical protein [Salmonella enterica subsp. enterica serovar Kidderminster]